MMNPVPLVVSLFSMFLQIGGMDLAVMEKWAAASIVKYRVEGVHNARESVVFGDHEAKADVIDKLTVEFTWDVSKTSVVGPVTVVDGKSVITNIKSDGTNCAPPQLKGEYEHFQSVSNSMTTREQIQIKGTRTYPAAMVSNYPASCSLSPAAGGKEDATLWVSGVGPELLGMPNMPGVPYSASADRKSFSVKGAGNWVWTYTPTLVR